MLTPPMVTEVLIESSVLGRLPDIERTHLAKLVGRRKYRRGEVIFHRGDAGDVLHLISRGRVKVVLPTESGDEALLTILGPGEVFGEFALLDRAPRSATVVAIEPVETLTLGRRDFLHLLQRNPATARRLLVVLTKTIRRTSDEVRDLMFVDLRARLAKKLVELAESHGQRSAGSVALQLPLTQEELAGMVGATRTSINKVLRFYESQGTLVRHGRQIVILELNVLSSWAAR